MKFNHVAHHAHVHKSDLVTAVEGVIDSGIFLEGPQVQKLQKRLATFLKGGFVTTVASGHDALVIAIQSLQLKAGDEVIIPVNAYPTAFPILIAGATPVLADTDQNGQLDPTQVLAKITKKTKAIVMVHMYGLVGDLATVKKIARTNHLTLIEDCAQAFGSIYQNKPVGTIGDIGAFSFYPTKNLGTLGDGGALWTNKVRTQKFFQQAKAYGEQQKYHSQFISFHSRMPEIQAAITNVYLRSAKKDFAQKQRLAKYFRACLKEAQLEKFVTPYESALDSQPVQHLLVIKAQRRDELQKYLRQQKIETIIHYPLPIHFVKAFAFLNNKPGSFPMAEQLAKLKLSIPFHQYLSEKEIKKMIQHLQKFYQVTPLKK